jgi:hypothetical protein
VKVECHAKPAKIKLIKKPLRLGKRFPLLNVQSLYVAEL